MKINNSIYWLSGAPFIQTANVYAIDHGSGIVLIDCEQPSCYASLETQLRYWGIFEKITHVLITHHHHDHAGNAKLFRDRGAQIWAPEIDTPRIEAGGFYMEPYVERVFASMMGYPACTVDKRISDGEAFEIGNLKFKAISMPGHTAGSMFYETLVEGKNVMITGDVTYPSGSGKDVELCWQDSPDYSSRDYVESFLKVLSKEPDILLGGHGFPVLSKEAGTIKMAALKAWSERRNYV